MAQVQGKHDAGGSFLSVNKDNVILYITISLVGISALSLLASLGVSGAGLAGLLNHFPALAHIWGPLPELMIISPIIVLICIKIVFAILYGIARQLDAPSEPEIKQDEKKVEEKIEDNEDDSATEGQAQLEVDKKEEDEPNVVIETEKDEHKTENTDLNSQEVSHKKKVTVAKAENHDKDIDGETNKEVAEGVEKREEIPGESLDQVKSQKREQVDGNGEEAKVVETFEETPTIQSLLGNEIVTMTGNGDFVTPSSQEENTNDSTTSSDEFKVTAPDVPIVDEDEDMSEEDMDINNTDQTGAKEGDNKEANFGDDGQSHGSILIKKEGKKKETVNSKVDPAPKKENWEQQKTCSRTKTATSKETTREMA